MSIVMAVAPNADPQMSKNAPRPGSTPTSANFERTAGGYGWHPEGIFRRKEFSFPSFCGEEMLSLVAILVLQESFPQRLCMYRPNYKSQLHSGAEGKIYDRTIQLDRFTLS